MANKIDINLWLTHNDATNAQKVKCICQSEDGKKKKKTGWRVEPIQSDSQRTNVTHARIDFYGIKQKHLATAQ